ncbi:SGNH/GDSL hydrolase family protein [Ruegeria aquimaris]|uniref:SGNH/GDSL hydrolase family protein n=1 Tax=Ruegeria aquimaris TaxID=2984333 RepID=A0ABT3AFZ7_9RHOB|nr:SGNH/GDSL hydrolase family protein [Ruegeria sp. XHP0148]MCV2887606.1 SGNH/GDSL hydrolase family protein [Ruegeria sp. XHP0148]
MRRKAQLLAEPAGPRAGRAGSGPALRLLIAGDSAAAGVGVDSQDLALSGQLVLRLARRFSVDWRLEATTGHTTRDTLARLGALPGPFDVVVTSLGVNDTTRATSARQFVARQAALMDLLTGPLGARLVVVTSVPDMALFPALPQPLSWVLGQQSQRLDRKLALTLKRYPQAVHHRPQIPPDPAMAARDGYHPSALAYAHWAEGLARVIAAQARRI